MCMEGDLSCLLTNPGSRPALPSVCLALQRHMGSGAIADRVAVGEHDGSLISALDQLLLVKIAAEAHGLHMGLSVITDRLTGKW